MDRFLNNLIKEIIGLLKKKIYPSLRDRLNNFFIVLLITNKINYFIKSE